MKRKMLIPIILIAIILLNCILPVAEVWAADAVTTSVEITVDRQLYTALKTRLGDKATYNDAMRKIKISQEEIANVKELTLANFAIDDIEGLETFTELTYLDLSSNELSEESDLSFLNELTNLTYLDISSNAIRSLENVNPEILENLDKLNLHNQNFDVVEVIEVDVSEDSDHLKRVNIKLPQILSYTNLKDEYLKELVEIWNWYDKGYPYIDWRTFDGESVDLIVGEEDDNYNYTVREGWDVLNINISDSEDILANSNINVHFIVVNSEETGVIFKDKNLYEAVLEQLTEQQDLNPDLDSYLTDERLYEWTYDSTNATHSPFMTYDPVYVITIDKDDIINRIPSLILDSRQIEDITGIQEFVGLEEKLDLSSNYIDNLKRLGELQENKIAKEEELRNKVETQIGKIKEARSEVVALEKTVKDLNDKVIDIEKQLSNTNLTEEQRTALVQQLAETKTQLATAMAKLESARERLETRTARLYEIYEKMYRILNISTVELASLTKEKFEFIKLEEARELYKTQVARYATLEEIGGLLAIESEYLINKYGIPTTMIITDSEGNSEEVAIEKPIKAFFDGKVKEAEDWDLSEIKYQIKLLKEVEVISGMATYCTINKLYDVNAECVCQEFLDKYIEEKEEEEEFYSIPAGIDTTTCSTTATYGDVFVISGKASIVTSEEIQKYVFLPRLKVLDLRDNLIDNLEDLTTLVELEELYLGDNEIGDISNIDWSVFVELERLDISFNMISDISPLNVISTLEYLDASKNLLTVSDQLNISNLSDDFWYLDLSRNQISDISPLLLKVATLARAAGYKSDIASFIHDGLYEENGVNFKLYLYSQELEIITAFEQSGSTANIDLPKIFAQIEKLQPSETTFNINSYHGNVSNKGEYAQVDTTTLGNNKATVTIASTEKGDSIGSGTKCIIYYTVLEEGALTEDVEPPVENIPEDNNTVVPEDNNTVVPEDNNTVVPDDNNTVVPDDNNTVVPDDNNTVVPDDNNTVVPDDNTPTVDTETGDDVAGEGYVVKSDYIKNVSPNTDVATFVSKLNDKYSVAIVSEGDVVTEGMVATGMMLEVYLDEKLVDIFVIVVKGDINGDGIADALDSGLLREQRAGNTTLTGAYAEAADVNNDGIIDAYDSKLILYHRAGVDGYIL